MNSIETVKKCNAWAEAVLRRDVMEADCMNFVELADKMCNNIVYLTTKFLKENNEL